MDGHFRDDVYTTLCSEKTLQANSSGFFMDFVKLVTENVEKDWIDNVFGKLKTDADRIRTIYSYEKTRVPVIDVLSNVQEIFRRKNAQISNKKRLEAEESFANGDLQKALLLYSQSILRSPKIGTTESTAETDITSAGNVRTRTPGLLDKYFDSSYPLKTTLQSTQDFNTLRINELLPVALMGRANVHISQNDYDLALADIQHAVKENLPPAYKAEAFLKMGICYKALNQQDRANVAFNLAQKLLGSKMKMEDFKRCKNGTYLQRKNDSRKRLATIEGGRHPMFPCASKKISIKQKKGAGRYVVASEEIKTGETLAVEPPYAACLLPEMFGTHCHHCFERLVSPIGCIDCSNVAFCNTECRSAALSTYHRFECKFLDLLIGSGMSVLSHTALRMITQNSLERCLEIYADRSKENVYSLCTNDAMRSPEDFLQRTLMAAFLLRCLHRSGYFGNRDRNMVMPTDEEYRIGELLLFHLQMLQFNAHEIYETRTGPEGRIKGSKIVNIGVAVYPTVALFNHQCYPAVARYFVGKNIVIKSLRPLRVNDVIPENYGPIFTRRRLRERKRCLSARYWFDCDCDACKFSWPTFDEGLENFTKQVKCTNEKCNNYFALPLSNETLTCPKCKEQVTLTQNLQLLKWCEEQYEKGFKKMEEDDLEAAADTFCAALDVFHRISCPPHKETHLAQEAFQRCMADSGNVNQNVSKK